MFLLRRLEGMTIKNMIQRVSPFVEVITGRDGWRRRQSTPLAKFIAGLVVAGAIVATAYVHFNPIIN